MRGRRSPSSRAQGPWLVEAGGERYLDLGAGIAVTLLGHAHPALVAALEAQARKLWHTSNLYQIPNQEALAERLVAATFADTVFVTNSGTEAIECAIKMARKHFDHIGQPERNRIITFEGAFHGRSYGAISAAGSEKMVKGFGPVVPGFDHVPFGDLAAVRGGDRAGDRGDPGRADPGRGRHPGAAAARTCGRCARSATSTGCC